MKIKICLLSQRQKEKKKKKKLPRGKEGNLKGYRVNSKLFYV